MYNTNYPEMNIVYERNKSSYSFDFKIYNESDLYVYNKQLDGTLNEITYYDTFINGDYGGSITLKDLYEEGSTLILLRQLEIDREIQYTPSGDLNYNILNIDQDYQTYLIDDAKVSIDQALRLPFGSTASNIFPEGANQYIKWNDEGTELVASTELTQDIKDEIDEYIEEMTLPTGEPTNIEYFVSDGSGFVTTSIHYNTIQVYSNGALLTPGTDYLYSVNQITFTPFLPVGSNVTAIGWEGDTGAPIIETFRDLTDTPSSYLGMKEKLVSVSADETKLVFTDPSDLDSDAYVLKSGFAIEGDEMTGPLVIKNPEIDETGLHVIQTHHESPAITITKPSTEDYVSLHFSEGGDIVGNPTTTQWSISANGRNSLVVGTHDVTGTHEFNAISITNDGKVDLNKGGTINSYTPSAPKDIATVEYVDTVVTGGTSTSYLKKTGYDHSTEEGRANHMSGPLVILNQGGTPEDPQVGLRIKQYNDLADAIAIHSEDDSEYSSLGFYDEDGTGAFTKTWGIATQSNDQMLIGPYDDTGTAYTGAIHINKQGTVTANGLLSTQVGNGKMESGYSPTTDLSVATKEYVDDNFSRKERVLVWEKTPTTGDIALSSLPINPDTNNRTGEYFVVFSDSPTLVTDPNGKPNVSVLYIFNEAQHSSGSTTGYTPGSGTQLAFAISSAGNIQAWKYESQGSDVRWYIQRIYRLQNVGSTGLAQVGSFGQGGIL